MDKDVRIVRELYKVRKQKNVWKFPYLWGGGGGRPRNLINKRYSKST